MKINPTLISRETEIAERREEVEVLVWARFH